MEILCKCVTFGYNDILDITFCEECGEVVNNNNKYILIPEIKMDYKSDYGRITFKNSKNIKVPTINDTIKKYTVINSSVVEYADTLFKLLFDNKSYKGANRRSLIAACLSESYKKFGYNVPIEVTADKLNVGNKLNFGIKTLEIGLQTMKYDRLVNNHIHSNPVSDIKNVLYIWENGHTVEDDVINMYYKVKDKTELMKCKSKSIAVGVIYTYFLLTKRNISLNYLSRLSNLSESTILKIHKYINI